MTGPRNDASGDQPVRPGRARGRSGGAGRLAPWRWRLPRNLATIARLAGPPTALAVLATIVLVSALVTFQGMRSLAVNAWLLAVGGLLVWTCWRALATALPTAAASEFDFVRNRPPEQPSELRDAKTIVAVIVDSERSWRSVEFRLRPMLRTVAAARLVERYQVDLEEEPAAAHRILGDELWELVGPGTYGPAEADRTAGEIPGLPGTDQTHTRGRGGIPRATIKRAVDLLEAL